MLGCFAPLGCKLDQTALAIMEYGKFSLLIQVIFMQYCHSSSSYS